MRDRVKMETIMGLMLLLAAYLLARGGAIEVSSTQVQKAERTVVIDAGHGGRRSRKGRHRGRTGKRCESGNLKKTSEISGGKRDSGSYDKRG